MEVRVPKSSTTLLRGIAVLAVVIVAAGAMTPALSASNLTKAKVKAIATKAAVGEIKSALMAATVPVGNSCTITAQTGGVTAATSGTNCDVTFPAPIQNCSVGATPLHPTGDLGGQASIRYLSASAVRVGRYDGSGGTSTAGLFSVFAVCPSG